MKIIRVHVAGSEELREVKLQVLDLLVLLNRHYRPHGVVFEPTIPSEGAQHSDWAIAIYGASFGDLSKEQFEAGYETFQKKGKPKIYLFFQEPAAPMPEPLKAFRDSFESQYGYFYCRFETVDSIKFQLSVQSLSLLSDLLPQEKLHVEDGVVKLGGEPLAKLDNLPFAKQNRDRQKLLYQLSAAEQDVARLEQELYERPNDQILVDSVRDARMKRIRYKKVLAQYDQCLFDSAVDFAKKSFGELNKCGREARDLFEQGRISDALELLDPTKILDAYQTTTLALNQAKKELDRKNVQTGREAIRNLVSRAEIVQANIKWTGTKRNRCARQAYVSAIRVANEIQLEEKELANIYSSYGYCLAKQNRVRFAITLYSKSLAIQRKVAVNQPDAEVSLAGILNDLALLHEKTLRFREAEAEFTEALRIYRKYVSIQSASYESYVAWTLNNRAALHVRMQQIVEAEAEFAEVLSIRRNLAAEQSKVYAGDVADVLNNLAVIHDNMQRLKEAAAEYEEALCISRRVSMEQPERYLPNLARILNNVAIFHDKTHQMSEAEAEYREALAIRRELSQSDPEAYEGAVARTLENLSVLHKKLNRLAEAETESREALAIQQKLARKQPQAYEPDVAIMLRNIANLHSDKKQWDDSAAEYREALTIQRQLAELNPEAYKPAVAETLNNLAVLHCKTQRPMEAQAELREAVRIYRELVVTQPDTYRFYLAGTLHNLANLYTGKRQLPEAEVAYKEALAIRRSLAAANPVVFQSDMLQTLTNLAQLHSNTHRLEEAEAEYKEMLLVQRTLAMSFSEAYQPAIAQTLHTLAILHTDMQRMDEAEAEYKDALVRYRRLEEMHSGAYKLMVAKTLHNLAACHAAMHRLGEAEAEYNEALTIYHKLPKENFEDYKVDVAVMLYNLTLFYLRGKDAFLFMKYAKESLVLYKNLAWQSPGQYGFMCIKVWGLRWSFLMIPCGFGILLLLLITAIMYCLKH